MRLTDARKVAIASVLVAAVLAASLVVPAIGQVLTLEGTWLAAAILGLPTAAVLTATGYRRYGLGRSLETGAEARTSSGVVSIRSRWPRWDGRT